MSVASENRALAPPTPGLLPTNALQCHKVNLSPPRPDRHREPGIAVAQSHQERPCRQRQRYQERPAGIEPDMPTLLGKDNQPEGEHNDSWYELVKPRRPGGSLAGSRRQPVCILELRRNISYGCPPPMRPGTAPNRSQESPAQQGFLHGRYWARTSDPQLVELVLSQLS